MSNVDYTCCKRTDACKDISKGTGRDCACTRSVLDKFEYLTTWHLTDGGHFWVMRGGKKCNDLHGERRKLPDLKNGREAC